MSDNLISLHADQAEDLAHTLGLIEDWLAHAGDDVLDELARFGSTPLGRYGVTALVTALGDYGLTLHRLLRRTPAHPLGDDIGTPRTQPVASQTRHGADDPNHTLTTTSGDTGGSAGVLTGAHAAYQGKTNPSNHPHTRGDTTGHPAPTPPHRTEANTHADQGGNQ